MSIGQLSSETGRFAFGQISEYRRDVFLLDTQTGRIWILAESPETKRLSFVRLYVEGLNHLLYESLSTIGEEIRKKNQKEDAKEE
jgi:hypothetical protein